MPSEFECSQVQKYAKKWDKMLIRVVEYSLNKIHVEVVKNTKIVMVEINKVRVFGLFSILKNL